ncbi:MAG: hypothetical protein Q4D58_09790 [Synergistaceae bacterium]|nr:hypothetical protein [Synergistaceae bacterium]
MADAEARQASSLVEFRRYNLAAPDDVEAAPFHEEWSRLLLFGRMHEAIEGYRESAKDQYVFQGFSMFCLKYPAYERSYIVFVCATATIAANKLRAITRRFQSAECNGMRLHVERVIEDSGNAFQVLYKDGMQVRIEAYGKGSSIRGLVWGAKRPDIIILNDPQDPDDMYSPATLEKDWDWFLSDVIFMGNSTRLFVIGNNLGALCIIERIFANARELGFDCRRYPALDDDEKSTWPAKVSAEQLIAERESFRAMGKIDWWMREKMCRVMADESRPLKPELYQYYDPFTYDMKGCVVKVALDPAISEKKDADESVIAAAAISDDGHTDILEIDKGRRNPYEIVDALFRVVARWNPAMVGIETVAYQEMLAQEIERQQVRRGIFFNVVRIRGMRGRAAASKEQKIRMRLQPKLAVGAIRLPKGAPWVPSLLSQTREFPYGAHDDMIDTIAMLDDVRADLLVPNFDQHLCICGEFVVAKNWPQWCSLVADPTGETSMLFLTCSPEGKLYVTEQIFFKGTPEALFRRYRAVMGSRRPIMTAAPAVMFKANPISGEVWASSYTAAGFSLCTGPDDWGAQLTGLNQLFSVPYSGALPKLRIFPRCKRLIWELYHAVAGEQAQPDRKSIQALMLLLSCGPRWRDMVSMPLRGGRAIKYPPRDVP